MFILQIEHPVRNYEMWKKAFDGDPIGRKRNGVQRHRVLRSTDKLDYAIVELEFLTATEAQHMLNALKKLWGQVEGTLIDSVQARIVEVTEEVKY